MQDYPFITQRLWNAHKSARELESLLGLLGRHHAACDEVWFATDYGFPPLPVHEVAAVAMAAAAARVRALGIAASLQVSNTLGHGTHLDYLDFEGIRWQTIVGPDGATSVHNSCPRAPEFHAYLDASMRGYAAWRPDSVWIDDDLRMHGHGTVTYGCFCSNCIARFAEISGRAWTREDLAAALNAPDGLDIRRAWIAYGRQALSSLAQTIACAVKAVAPDCRMGLQHADHWWGGYNGTDLAPIFERLARTSGRPAGSRPGGGFYVDHSPRQMLGKHLMTGQQNSRLPDVVDDVRVEVENLPGAVTGKSAYGTAVEATMALAYGCTGLTFTPLMFLHEEMAWHETMLAELAAWRPFWLRFVAVAGDARPGGLAIADGRQYFERPLAPGERPFAWTNGYQGDFASLLPTGLPLGWDRTVAPAVLLHPGAIPGLTDAEIRDLPRRHVMTDGEALVRLRQRGFVDDIPLAPIPYDPCAAVEWLTDDPLNGRFAGRTTVLTCFGRGGAAHALETQGDARVITRYAMADGTPRTAAAALVTTRAGGRWAVFGNGCWSATITTAQRAQRLAAADWVAGALLPAVLDTPCQVVVVPRVDTCGCVAAVMLLNASLDSTSSLHLRVRNPSARRAEWWQPRASPVDVAEFRNDGTEASLELPGLAPWGCAAVLFGEGR